jgi:hypothetical protein
MPKSKKARSLRAFMIKYKKARFCRSGLFYNLFIDEKFYLRPLFTSCATKMMLLALLC